MKKLLVVSSALALALTAGAVNACPKGQHMEGGTGAHHKGGKCVPTMKKEAMPAAAASMPAAKS